MASEAACWKNGVAALKKARLEEERAHKKAQEKLRKQEEAKRVAEEARRKKKEEREAARAEVKAAAEAARRASEDGKAIEDDDNEDAEKRRARHRRTTKDLDETDPSVLRHLRSSQLLSPTRTVDSIQDFLEQIASIPGVLAVARLKKGSIRKVLMASRLPVETKPVRFSHSAQLTGSVLAPALSFAPKVAPGMTSTEANAVSKNMNQDGSRFSMEIGAKFEDGSCTGCKVLPCEGPASTIGLDLKLQMQIEALHSAANTVSEAVIGRDHVISQNLVKDQRLMFSRLVASPF